MSAALLRMSAYLQALPRGIDSYPDHVQKASVYREFLADMPSTDLVGLPAPVELLLTRPLPVSAWVPEVHAHALYLAVADVHLPDEAEFLARKLETNRRILRGPLYRLLMMVASPELLIRGAVNRWRTFHRGIVLSSEQRRPRTVDVRMSFPPSLMPDLMMRTYATVFQAAIEAAGGKEVSFSVRESGVTFVEYAGRWTR